MKNILSLNLTCAEIAGIRSTHKTGQSDELMQNITLLFSDMLAKHNTDVISDPVDAEAYCDAVRTLPVVRDNNGETIGFTILTTSKMKEGHNGKEQYLSFDTEVFIAAMNRNSSGKFELHYNFVSYEEFMSEPGYFPR